ncbi:MAG: archaetidylserine decarboxylase [Chromatiales bacterium]
MNERAPDTAPAGATWTDRLQTWPQYLLPQRLLSRIIHAATRSRTWKDLLIRRFARHYGVDMDEALEPDLGRYAHFNDFFTRALRPGVRAFPQSGDVVASPVDGYISQIGYLHADLLIQAKGRHYTLSALLGGERALAAQFQSGAYATLYLSPRDYHRVHMPVDGTLREMIYVPGKLFAVNPRTTRVINNLFARNERLICLFDSAAGPLAVLLVGAIFVSSMETVWEGVIGPGGRQTCRRWDYGASAHAFRRGAEIARFNMGSTVILLFGRDRVRWDAVWPPGMALRLGMPLGRLHNQSVRPG